jgi:hypothetical protein
MLQGRQVSMNPCPCENKMLPKKIVRMLKRKERLEELVLDGRVFCLKHSKYLCYQDIQRHKCYTGNHGYSICKYVQEMER